MLSRGNSLMDEDPGIMSEAETSATGFRRGSKPRPSLPVVRTPSKTLERPLGLVFLQYRNETKRALLPNEITTLDTVRALFVRSFARQLSMEYFDSNHVRIYIHDPNQDMFYELEDLRDIRDRSILRLYETDGFGKYPINFQSALPLSLSQLSFMDEFGPDAEPPLDFLDAAARFMPNSPLSSTTWDDLSYFSEPELESDSRHIYKAKNRGTKPLDIGLSNGGGGGGGRQILSSSAPGQPHHGSTASLAPLSIIPRSFQGRAALHRSFSIAVEQTPPSPRLDRNNDTVSPGKSLGRDYDGAVACDPQGRWEEDRSEGITSFFSQQLPPQVPPRPPERSFHNYSISSSVKSSYVAQPTAQPPPSTAYGRPAVGFNDLRPTPPVIFQNSTETPVVDDQTRKRMELVERQLANLTGLVQTALTATVHVQPPSRPESVADFAETNAPLAVPSDGELGVARHLTVKTPRLGKNNKDKCVSFEKSVSFCDDPVDLHEGRYSPQPTESKPAKPAIKSSTLPRASSQVSVYKGDSGWMGNMETYTQLRLLQRNARDLRSEMRSLRRLSLAQLSAVKEAVRDTIQIMKKTFFIHSDIITNALSEDQPSAVDVSLRNIHRQEENYQKEMKQLEMDLSELETSVETLRSHVINKKTRVSMADVEQLATLLSRSSKSVDQLKTQYPALEESIKGVLSYQMERQAEESRFLVEVPTKLENTIGRCKKLTSTLVTLRRLASVQEQRQPHTLPEKPVVSKCVPNYPTPADPPPSATRNNSQQGVSWCETAQQSDAFSASLQPAHGAVDADCGTAASRNASRIADQQQQQPAGLPVESRSFNALDTLLDELKLYSETNKLEKPVDPLTTTSTTATTITTTRTTPAKQRTGAALSFDSSKATTLMSSAPSSTSYAESSVDSVVTANNGVTTNRARRAPPPPPPRTSSRTHASPLASPLRSPHQPRPLPDLPIKTEMNRLETPLSCPSTTTAAVAGQQTLRRNSSLPTSTDSKVPSQSGSIDNDQQPPSHSSQTDHRRAAAPTVTPATFFGSLGRATSHLGNSRAVAYSDVGASLIQPPASPKRESLESRHQELLKTQRQLQERFDRLQKIHGSQLMPSVGGSTFGISVPSETAEAAAVTITTTTTQPDSAQTTETCSGQSANTQSNEVQRQEVRKSSGNSSKLVEQLSSSLETDEMSVSSTTSSMMTEIECDNRGKDFRFISLLLDSTHETDIL